jgi:large subunit ribosomal protein L9
MKVILLQDVPGMGRKYDVKGVKDGYARNFLIPRKLAEIATPQKIKIIEINKKQSWQKKVIWKNILEKNIEALKELKVTIKEKANEKGHLFAMIHQEEISRILKEQNHIEIPPELIEIEKPIKEIGEHKIKVKNQEFILEVI